MMNARILLPTLALGVSLALTGCGGNDGTDAKPSETTTSAAPAISTADFTEQANAVCSSGNAEIQSAADALGDAPSQDEIEAFAADTLVPNIQGQHDDIEALGAPEGSEADVTAMLDSLQGGIDAVQADPSLITSDTNPFGEANDLAGGLGLMECTG